MPESIPLLSPNEPDQALLNRLGRLKRISLGAVALISTLNACAAWFAGLACAISAGSRLMGSDAALAALLCAISLHLSERASVRLRQLGLVLAALVVLLASGVVVAAHFQPGGGAGPLPNDCGVPGVSLTTPTAAAFILLAACVLLARIRTRFATRLTDIALFALCLLVLILISSYILGALRVFESPSGAAASPQTLLCLALLTCVAVLCRADTGTFSIFFGRGTGSRLARALVPLFLVMQFVRAAARVHIVRAHILPPHYASATLASVATMLSLMVLLVLAWRINSMEARIQELSLRDDLTGLYNLRGFTLLAEQALRLAQRTQMAFSILYIDLDNLKQTNDTLGHQAGSSLLCETGQLLKTTFRETDVMGRIGGDEFAVAGHFSPAAISIATERLRAACRARAADAALPFPLAFSVGCATADANSAQSLKDLLHAADEAMYEEKRRKKAAGG